MTHYRSMVGLRDLKERTVVVTGASSGIGRGLARALSAAGARVALVARRRDRLEEVAGEIRDAGGEALVVVSDVASDASVEAAAARILKEWGPVDLLINAAGYAKHHLFKDEAAPEAERMMAVNYFGTTRWIRALLPSMQARGWGWIVNVSSFAGKLGQPDEASYSASKFAVTGLSEGLAMELAPLGIHVMCVYPVLVRTEMFEQAILDRMPPGTLQSFIEVEEFSKVVLAALGRGAHEVTVPRRFGLVYLVRILFPGFLRRQTSRLRLSLLPELREPRRG